MMKFVLDEMFEEAGERIEDYLEAVELDPDVPARLQRSFYGHDQRSRGYEAGDCAGCFRAAKPIWINFSHARESDFEKVFPCLQKDYSSFKEFFNPIFLKAIPYIPLGTSIFDYLGNYFGEEKLRLCFTFQSKYLGMSPWECPGFFSILPFVEHKFGIFHVQGGLSRISEAMAAVATKRGARIRTGAEVKQIIVENGKAKGVRLAGDEKVIGRRSDSQCRFCLRDEQSDSLRNSEEYSPQKLEKKRYSCSTFMFYLGVDKIYRDLPHHTVVFADDYRSSIQSIFDSKELTEDISFYIRNSAVTDPHVAPSWALGIVCSGARAQPEIRN